MADSARGMTIVSFPKGWHPYQQCYARALQRHGIWAHEGKDFSNQWLSANKQQIDGVHFHWVEHLWQSPSYVQSLWSVLGVWVFCAAARRLGKQILWTVHNHRAHEDRNLIDDLGFKLIGSLADIIIVHSQWSKEMVTATLKPRGKVIVMPHGNFDGIFQWQRTREDMRAQHHLRPETALCGVIGGIRPYRGHELAIEATRQARGAFKLFIAGNYHDQRYVDSLRHLARDMPDVLIHPGHLTDQEYAETVRMCDVVLLPYAEITSSGALLSAWTLSRPVVMTSMPYFREFAPEHQAAGMVLKDNTPADIVASINTLLAIPHEQREAAARHEADRYPWAAVVQPVVEAMEEWRVQKGLRG